MRPDSRLSEWRTRRGTRGFVTTLEDSTGSVGASIEPSRKLSVQPRPVSSCAASATIAAVIGIAMTSLRNGSRHSRWSISASTSSPSRKRITTSATVARTATKPEPASNSSTFRPPSPSTKPASTKSAVSERNERWARPDSSAPPMSTAPKTSSGHVERGPCGQRSSSRGRVPDRVRLTVLGKSPSWQDADGACSGYLVEEAGVRLLLDCGSGVFAKLRAAVDYHDVDVVVITHLHADHFLDLVPYAYALTYGPRRRADAAGAARAAGRARVLAPRRRRLGERRPDRGRVRRARVRPGRDAARGPAHDPLPARARTSCPPTPSSSSPPPAAGSRSAPTTGRRPSCAAFARGTDLLVLEATLLEPEQGLRGHITAAEAGEHAAAAGARRLVISHISDELDLEAARLAAERTFGGPVELARAGARYTI